MYRRYGMMMCMYSLLRQPVLASLCALSGLGIIFVIIRQLLEPGSSQWGWPSMVCIMLFLSGMQLFCLGVLGHYMSKIYLETKRRPAYIVRETSE